MTREEQLKSCTICTHRCMDMHKGLLCGLTQNAANFEGVCPNFEQDEKEFQKQQQIQQEVMNDENHTIGGWLAFFLWIGIGFGALMSVVIVCLSFSELLISTWLVVAQLVTLLCLCTIAISTIVAFYKRKSNAKALAYTYIATIVIDGIFAIAMYFAIADAQEMNLIDSIRSILWGIIWGTYLASSTRVEHIVPRPRTWHIFEKILAGILVCMYILMAIVVIDMQNNENSIFYNPRQVVKTILQEANKDLPYQDIDGTIQQCLFLQEDTIVYPYKFTQIDIKDCVVEDLQLTGIHTKQTILQEVALESTDAILSGNEYFFEHNYSVSFRYYDKWNTLLYSIAITPEDYANALAIGKQFRCDEADFQKAEDIVKSLLPIAYLWKDAKLANIYHTPDNLYYVIRLTDLYFADVCQIDKSYFRQTILSNFSDLEDALVSMAEINKMNIVFSFCGIDSNQAIEIVVTPQDYTQTAKDQ